MPYNFRPPSKFQNIPAIAGNLMHFSLKLMNKPSKFQRGIINPHIFTSICFQ